jgi:uncharacterized tellurite resistance protein B-like protein
MLNSIRTFFDAYLGVGPAAVVDPAQAARCAAAALLLEMAHMDETVTPAEQAAVIDAVRARFGLSPEQAQGLIACAQEEREQATDYHQFTSLINAHFDPAERAALIEQLWQVAYADQLLCKHEEYLVRKVANLLHVPHQTFIAAKHRVSDGKPGSAAQRRTAAGGRHCGMPVCLTANTWLPTCRPRQAGPVYMVQRSATPRTPPIPQSARQRSARAHDRSPGP